MKQHVLIPLFLMFLGLSGQAAALPIISLVPDNTKIHAGENLFIDVNVSGLQPGGVSSLLGAFSLDILFDPELNFSGANTWGFGLGDVGAGDAIVGGDISQVGSGRFSFYEVSLLDSIDLSALQSDSFRLATLTFYLPYGNALTSGSFINFSTENVVLSDDFGDQLTTGVNLGATVQVPEPPIALLFLIGMIPLLFKKKFSRTSDSKQSVKKMCVMKTAVLVGILTTIGIGTVNAAPTWTSFVPTGSISPLGFGMLPASDYISGARDDMYTWYCDLTVQNCPPRSNYSRAHFRQTFTLPQEQGIRLYSWGSISIVADDYFALYINNKLVGESWLDDKNALTTFDNIANYMVPGQENVVDIFVCDGDKGDSSAGQTPDGGFHACTNATSRVNHWLLVSGQFQVEENELGGAVLKTVTFRSGEPSDWQVRALIADPISSDVVFPNVCQSHKDIIGNPIACTLGELISNPSAYIDIDGTRFGGFFHFDFSSQELQNILVDPVLEKIGTRSLVGLRFIPTSGLASLLEHYSSDDYFVSKSFEYNVSVENGDPIYASNLSLNINDWFYVGGIKLQGGVSSTLQWPGEDVFMRASCSPRDNGSSCPAFKNSTFDSTNELFVSNSLFIQHQGFTYGNDGMRLTKLSQTYLRAPNNASPSDLVDLNADGCVDKTDVNLVLAQLKNPDASLLYDLNGDGKVNIADSRKLVTLFTNPRGAACN